MDDAVMIPEGASAIAEDILSLCRKKGLSLAVAESCTGGLVAACLTSVPGSSEVFDRGFVTYSNEAKSALLGVPEAVISAHGAVSEEVVRAMAQGCLEKSAAALSAAVTGIAGPGGGTALKPVGLVYLAVARKGRETLCQRHVFPGDRDSVRAQAVKAVLTLLQKQAG
jgi:nicotinamide-nucleotide amidase